MLLSFALIGIWVTVPSLEQYSLQLVALTLIAFLFLRIKHNREQLFSIVPLPTNSELIPLTVLFMLLISATGNTHSWAYPFTYVYLFMIVFSLEKKQAALIAGATFLLQLLLVETFTVQEAIILLNIPLITGIMLFARHQQVKAEVDERLLSEEEAELVISLEEVTTLESYIQNFLLPKTESLETLENPTTPLEKTLHSQITLIVSESKKILERVRT